MESGQGARAMEGKNYGKGIWGVMTEVLGKVHLWAALLVWCCVVLLRFVAIGCEIPARRKKWVGMRNSVLRDLEMEDRETMRNMIGEIWILENCLLDMY